MIDAAADGTDGPEYRLGRTPAVQAQIDFGGMIVWRAFHPYLALRTGLGSRAGDRRSQGSASPRGELRVPRTWVASNGNREIDRPTTGYSARGRSAMPGGVSRRAGIQEE